MKRRLSQEEKEARTVTLAVLGLVISLVFAFYHGALGLLAGSLWFGSLCLYYLLLGTMRFLALIEKKHKEPHREYRSMGHVGALFIVTTLVLFLILFVTLSENKATVHGTIPMITIAAFTFWKIGAAIVRARSHHSPSPRLAVIRMIGYAEVAVSVFTMQRSMLVSFGEMAEKEIRIFNLFTGIAVCFFIGILGIWMLKTAITKGTSHHVK